MLINITIQTFTSQNELELSVSRWDEIKHEYMPKFYKLGLARYTTSRIWNKTEKHQLAHIFEYQDQKSMEDCLPIWGAIEQRWREKITNKTLSYRGIQIDCLDPSDRMTKLSTIPQHQLSITCGLCKHHTMLEVANLIAVVGGDTTAHEVRQRARCNNCGVKGKNTYQIV